MGDNEDHPSDDIRVARFTEGVEELVVISIPKCNTRLLEQLSPSEQDVAIQSLEGRSTREIAEARESSVRTVENQLASVFRKLGVRSRGELASRLAGPAD